MSNKRKERLDAADQMMLELIACYYKEIGTIPNSSQLKRTCTIARDRAISMVYDDVRRRIKSNCPVYAELARQPDFDAGLKDTIKEIESDVQDFWLRRKYP